MLLLNELKEYKLINGYIVIVKIIFFEHKDGPRHIPYELPACVIAEFKQSTFAGGTKWRTDVDIKYVPINPTTIRCDKILYCYIYSIKSL